MRATRVCRAFLIAKGLVSAEDADGRYKDT